MLAKFQCAAILHTAIKDAGREYLRRLKRYQSSYLSSRNLVGVRVTYYLPYPGRSLLNFLLHYSSQSLVGVSVPNPCIALKNRPIIITK